MSKTEGGMDRRTFLERLGLGAGAGATGAAVFNILSKARAATTPDPAAQALAAMNQGAFGAILTNDVQAASLPAPVQTPNILIIMVDQLRLPQYWVSSSQQTTIDAQFAPTIAFLRKNSVTFQQFNVAATACTPSRAALLTGLYAPQTAQFVTEFEDEVPALDTRFPTFGSALANLVP